jgi:hypothetical protein
VSWSKNSPRKFGYGERLQTQEGGELLQDLIDNRSANIVQKKVKHAADTVMKARE